jgi:hypothetical protein
LRAEANAARRGAASGPGLGVTPAAVHIGAMSRKLIALLLGLAGFALYVGVVVALADHVLGWHWALQLAYFLLAGLAWAWPARVLMVWAARAG